MSKKTEPASIDSEATPAAAAEAVALPEPSGLSLFGLGLAHAEPEATESEDTPPKSVTVAIDAEGLIKVNDVIVPAGMLAQMIGDAIEEAEEKIVVLKGDKLVLLGQAVNILDIAQQKGATGIALATQQPAPDE